MLEISDYFSLQRFSHSALWRPGEPIWSPLLLLNNYLMKSVFRIEIQIASGVHLERAELIAIGRNTVIEPGVFIQGPCIIGSNCILRHGAYLRGGVICGNRSVVGHGTEIKHSILLDDVAATHFAYIGDSIIGNGVNLGAGVKCANLRLDRKEVSIWDCGNRVLTGLKKFGAVIGDRVQIGCNCVLNPGTLIGKDSISYPLLHFGGSIPPFSQIEAAAKVHIEPITNPLFALRNRELTEKAHAP
ncbi:MAG TPA: LpxA family transferase [Chlamydiales bacterium]|nr:LpxA family transferase [Chlamydiales bacterium]